MLCQDIALIDRLLGSIVSPISRDTIWLLLRAATKRPQKTHITFFVII